jgi:hypothetical protein
MSEEIDHDRRRDRMAQLAAIDGAWPARKRHSHRRLDIYLHYWLRQLPYVRAWAEKYKNQVL